jgi:hypothetical protein
MARATLVKKAQKNIYERGKQVQYISKDGKKKGQTLSKTDRTIPADKSDKIFIAKGESYYWWAFQYRPKQYSKTQPKRSQLTGSDFLGQLYDMEDRLAECSVSSKEDFDSFKEELMDDIENLKSEQEDKLSNMPDQLQSAPSGELLQERIDGLENWHSELDGVECDIDEDEIREELKSENEDEEEKMNEDEIEVEVQEKVMEKVGEALEELQNTSAGL